MKHSASPSDVFDAFRKSMLGKSDDWKDLVSDDVVLTAPLAEGSSRDEFIEINTPFFASIRGSELHRKLVDGNTVATRITTTVAAPGGMDIPLDVSEWYEIEDGKITALRTYFDASALRDQMKREHTVNGPTHR